MTTGDVWASTAIALGAWEALSVLDERMPRVSHAAWAASRRWPLAARIGIVGWALALAWHLGRPPSRST
jgi:hypothetical protein